MTHQQDMRISIAIAQVEGQLLALRPHLPAKIALMESGLPTCPENFKAVVEHSIKVEKMILFLANELADLEKAAPPELAAMVGPNGIAAIIAPPPPKPPSTPTHETETKTQQ